MNPSLPLSATIEVRDRCLCFRTQKAARALARRFDTAFRPFDLTNGQFSLLMSLNRPSAPAMGEIAAFLAMDRTTLTAALKPLARRALIETRTDAKDLRTRRLQLTDSGRELLTEALPIWRAEHDLVDAALRALQVDRLKDGIDLLGNMDRAAGVMRSPRSGPS